MSSVAVRLPWGVPRRLPHSRSLGSVAKKRERNLLLPEDLPPPRQLSVSSDCGRQLTNPDVQDPGPLVHRPPPHPFSLSRRKAYRRNGKCNLTRHQSQHCPKRDQSTAYAPDTTHREASGITSVRSCGKLREPHRAGSVQGTRGRRPVLSKDRCHGTAREVSGSACG